MYCNDSYFYMSPFIDVQSFSRAGILVGAEWGRGDVMDT